MKPGQSRDFSKTLIAGAVAGLAGSWTMSQFTRLYHAEARSAQLDKPARRGLPYSQQEWDATSTIARIVALRVLGRRLSKREQRAGAAIVHYAVGAATGASYALLASRSGKVTSYSGIRYSGIIFGTALWLLADELLMPSIGACRWPRDYSVFMQANALGEHLVYGLTIDAMLRLL